MNFTKCFAIVIASVFVASSASPGRALPDPDGLLREITTLDLINDVDLEEPFSGTALQPSRSVQLPSCTTKCGTTCDASPVVEVPEFHVFVTACGAEAAMKNARTLIRSVYETSTSAKRAHVHITHDGGANTFKYLICPLELLLQERALDPKRLRITNSVTTVQQSLRNLFKPCAAARLTLAAEHPDVDTGLYLDADMYVTKDLSALFDRAKDFNKTQWCGMAPESEIAAGWYHSPGRWAGESNWKWFQPNGLNSGAMLANFTRWRKTQLTAFANSYTGPKRLGDQDILNAYFQLHREEMAVLPCEWNFRGDGHCPKHLDEAGILHGNNHRFVKRDGIKLQDAYFDFGEWIGLGK